MRSAPRIVVLALLLGGGCAAPAVDGGRVRYLAAPEGPAAASARAEVRDLVARINLAPGPVASCLVEELEQGDPERLSALIAELRSRGHLPADTPPSV